MLRRANAREPSVLALLGTLHAGQWLFILMLHTLLVCKVLGDGPVSKHILLYWFEVSLL